MPKTNIVILGAGFAGLTAAVGLAKKFKRNPDISLTLVDRHNYQLLNFNLYEVATAEEEFASVGEIKQSITVPIKKVLAGKKIKFIQSEIKEINPIQKTVQLTGQKLEYDYLICALGSETDYYGIEGAEKFGLPLKSLKDALMIRNQIEFSIQAHKQDFNKKNLRVVVAGGGYTGVEFAAELANVVKILAWKYQYPPEKIEIAVLEGAGALIPGFNKKLSQDAFNRLKDLGIRVQLSSMAAKVDEHFVYLLGGEKEAYDVLVWTTGVKAKSLPLAEQIDLDKKGRCIVNRRLQLISHHNIFVLGDQGCVMCQGKPAPCTAQDAIDQAKYVVQILPAMMKNQKPAEYIGKAHGFIVTGGGKWAILDYKPFYLKGSLAFLARQFAHIRYLSGILGFWMAVRFVWFEAEVFGRND